VSERGELQLSIGMTAGGRLYHTVRHLRPGQIAAQVSHRCRHWLGWPLAPAPKLAAEEPRLRWEPRAPFLASGPQRQRADRLLQGEFTFLNRSARIGWPPEWSQPALPRLWEYNLHYFEFLWALDARAARQAALDWISRHPAGRGQVGWEPYPISLRLMNWCAVFFGRDRGALPADREFERALWTSVRHQAETLSRNLETHLLGNHLLENGLALACCGACFQGEAADRWLRRGVSLLARELREQVLPDGGHFERSPMYHARAVYALSLLLDTGVPEVVETVSEPLGRMRRALACMCHPDGEIALLNDAAVGIANPAAQLLGAIPEDGVFALPDTGYFGARRGGSYVICDAAPVGPDYLPGHAHGDIFSFELSLHGQRMVVDAGVHDYETSELRAWCRSTRAHNTLEIDGADQCEFWGAFRVARRGRPRDVAWEELNGGFRLQGWHDGYERLDGRPRHERAFRWHPEGVLLVRDVVNAARSATCRTRLHLHPECEILEQDERRVRVGHPAGGFSVCFDGPGRLELEDSKYCPEFGVARENRALCFSADGERLETGFCIAPGAEAPAFRLESGASLGDRRFAW
jgi:uncharacterized heparinase superfamily protein